MTRLSARYLFVTKKLFPLAWFGLLALFVLLAVTQGAVRRQPAIIAIPGAMAVFGYVLMKKLVWDLVDEVYDCGDHLLIRNAGMEDIIRLSDISNVSASTLTRPPRISLRLARPGRFGAEVTFAPVTAFTLNPFAPNRVAEDLTARVGALHSLDIERKAGSLGH